MNLLRCNVCKAVNRFLLFSLVFVCIVKCFISGVSSSKECYHQNFTFGRPVYGQRLVNSTVVYKEGSIFGKKTCTVRFPPYGSSIKANISQVTVLNLYKKCNCYSDSAKIISGGIGKPYAEVSITAPYNCENYHQILFYNNTRRP